MRKGKKMARWQRLNLVAARANRDTRRKMSESMKAAWQRPEVRQKMTEAQNRPEVKQRKSEIMKARWESLDLREKRIAHLENAGDHPVSKPRKKTPMECYYMSEEAKARWEREDYREKMNQAIRRGADSPAWRGGLSFEPYSLAWTRKLKRSIRERDNYTCQNPECGCIQQKGERAFHVHHIDYVKEHCDPENLTTLCHQCHAKTNNQRDFWMRYLRFASSIKNSGPQVGSRHSARAVLDLPYRIVKGNLNTKSPSEAVSEAVIVKVNLPPEPLGIEIEG